MSSVPARPSGSGLTGVQWLICTIASIGFAFDIYELLMAPLVFPPAIQELVPGADPLTDGPPRELFLTWVGRLFYIPAFAGGLFGLLGGYLTDRLGRRRVLTYSILLYAVSAFLAGFSTSIWMLLVLRCTTFIGVCIEFVAAVAWLAELFPDPRRREKVLGYTQAFSSVGGLLVAVVYGLAVSYAQYLPAIAMPEFLIGTFGAIGETSQHAPWRYTLMSGLIPAIPLIIIRPFLPESPVWKAKKDAGTLKRPSLAELFTTPRLRYTTLITTLMFACSYGAAFGAIQQIQHIIPGLPQVQASVQESVAAVANDPETATKPEAEQERLKKVARVKTVQGTAANVTKVQEVGGLCGRFLLAVLAVIIVSRRGLIRIFLIPGLVVMPLVFAWAATNDLTWTYIGMFLAGLLTVGQFSFWGNYLPRVFPLHLRGTGESFAANIGGRMIGTSFAWVTATLAATDLFPGSGPAKTAYTAAAVACGVYAMNLILSFFLPQPPTELEEHETIGHAEVEPLIPPAPAADDS
ncbi:MAG: MFS transporter [Planctomycetes bacterium]|nr:MFS transporter [Planctomycetota bacterium]